MTQQQDADIRDYLDRKVTEVQESHRSQKQWLMAIIATLLGIFILIGTVEIRTTQRNRKDIMLLTEAARNTIRYTTVYQMNRTYELEFQALTAMINGEGNRFDEVMREFHDLRWQILQDEMNENREKFRGARKPEGGNSGAPD